MSAKIPQDVTREDRLVGPLTLRQFLIILGGGSVVFIAYQYYSKFYLYLAEFVAITFVASLLTIAFAFAKINGLPFGQFMANFFHFLLSPKRRLWNKEDREVMPTHLQNIPTKDSASASHNKSTNESQLELLAHVLDTGGKINENTPIDTNRIGSVAENSDAIAEPIVEDILEEVEE